MRTNPFESQLERLARTLTDQFGVQVVCHGDNAWTDGTKIVLPSVPEPMDDTLERMMVGYLDHEMSHVAFSDFDVAEQFSKKHSGYQGLLNVVEDALIERKAIERWPGVRRNLDMMFQQIRDRVAQLIAQRGPFERFCTAVYLKLSHHNDLMGLGRELVGYDDLLDRFSAIQNTQDAAGLAEMILTRWLKRQRQAGTPPSPRTGKNDASSNQSTAQPDENTSSDADRNSSGRQRSPGPDDSTSPQTAEQKQSSPGSGQESTADTNASVSDNADSSASGQSANSSDKGQNCPQQAPSDQDSTSTSGETRRASHHGGSLISEALTEAIAESMAQINGSNQYRVFTKQYDCIEVVPQASESDVQSLVDTGKDTARRLRRGLTNALRSAEKRWWRNDQIRGELSPRTLYRLCTDRSSLDVFRIRSVVQGKSTAVSIVLDASGSMTSRKMDVARSAMLVLLEALSDLKVVTEAFTFTTGSQMDFSQVTKQTGLDAQQLRERYTRLSNLEIGVIKRFEEPVKAALPRLPSIRGSGLTPLGEAMNIGASRLMPRPETRKIMLVLTDGKAGCEGNAESATQHAQYVTDRILKAGIELIGVGIMDDSLCAIVKDTIVIHQIEELPAQLCKLLGRTLRKGLKHVG